MLLRLCLSLCCVISCQPDSMFWRFDSYLQSRFAKTPLAVYATGLDVGSYVLDLGFAVFHHKHGVVVLIPKLNPLPYNSTLFYQLIPGELWVRYIDCQLVNRVYYAQSSLSGCS